MASSPVQICSNALLMLGAQTINSFDDESERATIVANLWPNSLLAILRAHPWNCAIKRVVLAPDVAAPAFEFPYAFTLPGDCLRLLSLGEDGEHLPYALEGRKILMHDNDCRLRYLYRNEDIPSWDTLLVAAAEAYMAMTCAYPITKSAAQVDAMSKLFTFKLQQARTIDAQENPPDTVGDFPLLNARR